MEKMRPVQCRQVNDKRLVVDRYRSSFDLDTPHALDLTTEFPVVLLEMDVLEDVRVASFFFVDSRETPSSELSHKGAHVANIKQLWHQFSSELFVILDGKRLTIWHPCNHVFVLRVFKDRH